MVDAINENDNKKICEELGDLLFLTSFCGKLAEKEKRFDLDAVLDDITTKLIRRHPHVFGNTTIEDSEQVVKQWEKIKSEEQAHAHRTSLLDGIPQALPALSRAQKMVKKMHKAHYSLPAPAKTENAEESLGFALLELVKEAQKAGIDAEVALRNVLATHEQKFRAWEKAET